MWRPSLAWLAVAVLVSALVGGCAPGLSSYQLRERSLSALNLEADRWNGQAVFVSQVSDAYGRPVFATITKGPVNYTLELRSAGADGLPKNSDDLVVTRVRPHGESSYTGEAAKSVEEVASGAASGVIKGIKKGFGAGKKAVDN